MASSPRAANRLRRLAAPAPILAALLLASAIPAGRGLAAAPPADRPDGPDARRAAPARAAAALDREPRLLLAAMVNDAFRLAASELLPLELAPPGGPLTVAVPFDGAVHVVDLVPHDIRTAGYALRAQQDDGSWVEHERSPVRTMRGVVRGDAASTVAMTRLDDGLHGVIALAGGARIWLEPVASRLPDAPPGLHVAYRGTDAIGSGGTCATTEAHVGDLDDPSRLGGAAGVVAPCGETGLCVAELANDADHEYFDAWGNSVAAVEARVLSVTNAMNVQYERDVNITHEITAILVRTSEFADPYTATDSFGLVNQLRDVWETNHDDIPRDLAQLFTGTDINGSTIGRAWGIGWVCTSGGYSFSQSDCCGSLACTTDLHAHENGHVWNGFHCNNSPGCGGTTMFTPLQCANVFSDTSIASITSHRDSRSCLDNPDFDCNGNAQLDEIDIASGLSADCNNNDVPDECENLGESCEVPNDLCADATPVSPGTTPFTTIGALTDGLEQPFGCPFDFEDWLVQSDVWFRVTTGDDPGTLTIGTCGSDFDTAIVVYGGTCPEDAFDLVACGSDECGDGAEVSILAGPGATYTIRVGSLADEQGSGELRVELEPFAQCGNGVLESGEACDDGNLVRGDGCDSECDVTCAPDCADGGDGAVDVTDLLAMLSAWNGAGPCDTDGSGGVDVVDLLNLLGAWGACP